MRITWKLVASLVSITTLALIAATTVTAANAVYTCVKVKQNGQQDVRVGVPESAVSGLTNGGFTCVPNAVEEQQDEEQQDDEQQGDELKDEEQTDEEQQDEEQQDEEQQDEEQQDKESVPVPANDPSVESSVSQESRSLYCSLKGVAHRANGEGTGISLNLLDSQGELMVELGLVEPANFYEGIGASCDSLSGFKYADVWVDHVGDVVPGVAVYPLFVSE